MVKKKILICGATGFIGRNISEFYAQKDDFDVYGTYYQSKPFNNQNIKMIEVDLTNKNEVWRLFQKKFNIVIQAAATTSGAKEIVNKPYYHVTDNAIMNSLIFRSAFENNVDHVVFLVAQ